MDILEKLEEMKEFSIKYGEVRHAYGRAKAHYEMFQSLNLYVTTHLSDENEIKAFEHFKEMIIEDLHHEIDIFEGLSHEYDEQMKQLDKNFKNKGENE